MYCDEFQINNDEVNRVTYNKTTTYKKQRLTFKIIFGKEFYESSLPTSKILEQLRYF